MKVKDKENRSKLKSHENDEDQPR